MQLKVENGCSIEIVFENSAESCTVVSGASILRSNLSRILSASYHQLTDSSDKIVSVSVCCIANVDRGLKPSYSFLSNISFNENMDADIARAVFASRDESFAILGYGSCSYFRQLDDLIHSNSVCSPLTIAVGGDPFDKGKNANAHDFGWFIPRVAVTTNDESWPKVHLTINLLVSAGHVFGDMSDQTDEALQMLQMIRWDFQPRVPDLNLSPMSSPFEHTGMNEEEYANAVNSLLLSIESGSVEKVVLALRKTGRLACPPAAASLLLSVTNNSQRDDGKRYVFLFAPKGTGRNSSVFVSLSPECLCKVQGSSLSTEALAGTFPKDSYKDYFGDEKTVREHGSVASYIEETLGVLGPVHVESKEILEMQNLLHFRQRLCVDASNEETGAGANSGKYLLAWGAKKLHPTPAVCGKPVEAAFDCIRKFEKFPRGMYASYCGVVSPTGGELLVGLRSAVVKGAEVSVFAGAGIVHGSEASSEWNEIALKMSQFLRTIESVRRPAMTREFPNATAAVCAFVVEEMLRQGVGAFCVCPGSRSTPLAVAIHRNSVARAMTQVVHDERVAGFFALGCARAGVLCAVLVTSGTAVANLLPAACEAREALLSIVLLTADRPAYSRDVGEAQSIKQPGLFANIVGWERDFPPPDSEAPKAAANTASSILSDIAFGIGEMAVNRNRVVHFNFQFLKPELEPEVIFSEFKETFTKSLAPRVNRWMSSLCPYTYHVSSLSKLPGALQQRLCVWIEDRRGIRASVSLIVIAGELRTTSDAIDLKHFCETHKIPCVCDVASGVPAANSSVLFHGCDRLLQSQLFSESLASSIRIVVRIGGSVISARTTEWIDKHLSLATMIRVRDDGAADVRHDPSWRADHYVHTDVSQFLRSFNELSLYYKPQAGMTTSRLVSSCPALRILQEAVSVSMTVKDGYWTDSLSFGDALTEPVISRVVQYEKGDTAIFLSSSMVCRDFDSFATSGAFLPKNEGGSARWPFRRIGCNRGANGIDGVISTAAGYAHACSTDVCPVTVLIGDIATLHDLTGVAVAASTQPGALAAVSSLRRAGEVKKIVCVNNSGGAIFSFLPAAKYREGGDFFTPLLDTPHDLNLSDIAAALCRHESQSSVSRSENGANNGQTDKSDRRAVRVSCVNDLRDALCNPSVFFIECVGLPTHVDNVAIHKRLGAELSVAIDGMLINKMIDSVKYTVHNRSKISESSNSDVMGDAVFVLFHGWMGSESDWAPLIPYLLDSYASTVLTVSFEWNEACPSVICHGLRNIIEQLGLIKRVSPILLMGYSLGGRLAMHYRHLFPSDVSALVLLSTAPGKSFSTDVEEAVIRITASASLTKSLRDFLTEWYSLPVFSDMATRCPAVLDRLISRRMTESGARIEKSIAEMVALTVTQDAFADLIIVGELDEKYNSLAAQAKATEVLIVPHCGHALLAEADPCLVLRMLESSSILRDNLIARGNNESPSAPLVVKILKFWYQRFSIPMNTPLEVQSNGTSTRYSSREGFRIHCRILEGNQSWVGIGEIYEPVFDLTGGDRQDTEKIIEQYIQTLSVILCKIDESNEKSLQASPSGVAVTVHKIIQYAFEALSSSDPESCASPGFPSVVYCALYGFEQSLLHAFSRGARVSLADSVTAYLGRSTRSSHVFLNAFASVRSSVRSGRADELSATALVNGKLKLKVGDHISAENWAGYAERVNLFVESVQQLHPGVQNGWLRLDANQSWTLHQACKFGDSLSERSILALDYVEEPLRGCEHIGRAYRDLFANSPAWRRIRIAFDESVCCFNRIDDDSRSYTQDLLSVSYPLPVQWVVKPSLVSLRSETLRKDQGSVTISCTFEGGLGLCFLVCVASAFNDTGGCRTYHGVHAKLDMCATDEHTRAFVGCIRVCAGPAASGATEVSKMASASFISVLDAEKQLDNYANNALEE